jgi:death on curing protein
MTHDLPTTQEVITIHEVLIEEFGGAPGIRDEADLISALMRPQLGYYEPSSRNRLRSWEAWRTIIP